MIESDAGRSDTRLVVWSSRHRSMSGVAAGVFALLAQTDGFDKGEVAAGVSASLP